VPDTDAPPRPLIDLTVEWLDALLSSASTDTIGVTNWWPRATSALITAAATADSYAHAVSVACRKLQIDVLSPGSAKTLAGLEPQISPRLTEWQTLAEQDAEYLVALTRLRRKAAAAARKSTKSPTPAVATATPEEAMF